MSDYWKSRFKEGGKVWGDEPSGTAIIASELFRKYKKKDILVIGSGYGRHTNYFHKEGFDVEGIEYSLDGVNIAREDNPSIKYYHGSAFDMPFSDKKYSAIYCYNVIHLFMKGQRSQLIKLCKEVLEEDGLLFVSAFSNEDSCFELGECIEENTFERKKGKIEHYYSLEELKFAFNEFMIVEEDNYVETVGSRVCQLRYIIASK